MKAAQGGQVKAVLYCVEDDSGIRELVVYTLNNMGFEAAGFSDAQELYTALSEKLPELILLDIMLPDEDGVEILKKLKSSSLYSSIPVIMLTAKSTEYDKVIGLDSGADDYITKPFGIMELVSRIRARLRASGSGSLKKEKSVYRCGALVVDEKAHTVSVDGTPIELTLKEFSLLLLLLKNPGVVLTRDVLLEKIWGYDFDGETRTVDVHVNSLRNKIGQCKNIIETVRGVGYVVRNVE